MLGKKINNISAEKNEPILNKKDKHVHWKRKENQNIEKNI
jgi:hypothetical protein